MADPVPPVYVTAAASGGPRLISISGQAGSDPLAYDGNVVLVFDQDVTASGTYRTFRITVDGIEVFREPSGSPRVSISGNTVTLDPELLLPVNSTFRIVADSGILLGSTGIGSEQVYTNFQTANTSDDLVLDGTDDRDYLSGGDGNDSVNGGEAGDRIFGNGGDDIVHGGGVLYTEGDVINGGDGNDTLYGEHGTDTLVGGAGNDLLDGGTHDDLISDNAGGNTISGGDGNDTITSDGTAVSVIDGGSGDDTISVAMDPQVAGASEVDGGDGNDSIRFSAAAPPLASLVLTGGAGTDTYVPGPYDAGAWAATVTDFAAGANGDRIDLTPFTIPSGFAGNPFAGAQPLLRLTPSGTGTLLELNVGGTYGAIMRLAGVSSGELTAANFVGGISPDGSLTGVSLSGTEFRDVLSGYLLNDTILGLAGLDILNGRGGDDYLVGGPDEAGDRPDDLYGEAGNDTLLGGGGEDQLQGGAGNDRLQGQLGNDTLAGNAGDDWMDGGAGDDSLIGGDGSDTLLGGTGDDRIRLAAVSGGGARHTVDAGDGNDTITLDFVNGQGASVLAAGGAGGDLFVILSNHLDVGYTISDFELNGVDHIDLLALLPSSLGDANPFGAAGYLRAVQDGNDTLIMRDRDGAAGSFYGWENVVRLAGIDAVSLQAQTFVGNYDPTGAEGGNVFGGSPANDFYDGSTFGDSLTGLEGNDTLYGRDGNDVLHGGGGTNTQLPDDDVLDGGAGSDRLYGEGGNDTLIGGADNDTLQGGDGDDSLAAGSGANVANGDAGDDFFTAGTGADTLAGGAGDDHFRFEEHITSTSTVFGDAGNDRVSLVYVSPVYGVPIDTHNVRATGGDGIDTYAFEIPNSDFSYRGQLTVTDFKAGPGGDVLDLFGLVTDSYARLAGNPFGERALLRAEQRGADTLIFSRFGTEPRVVLLGVTLETLTGANFRGYWDPLGSDTGISFTGGGASDSQPGTGMADTIYGLGGDDTLGGAFGDDMLDAGAGNDYLSGGDGSDSLYGGDGSDYLFDDGTVGTNLLDGGAGTDTLVSRRFGPSLLQGGDGDDTLISMVGNDTLVGGAGNDAFAFLSVRNSDYGPLAMSAAGGDGNDHFISLEPASARAAIVWTGGAGRDVYHVPAPVSELLQRVLITDFQPGDGGDRFDLRAVGRVDQVNSYAVTVVQEGADTIVQVAGSSFRLANVAATALTTSNFIYYDMGAGGMQISGSGSIAGGPLDDVLNGGWSIDTITGGAGRDRIDGGPYGDVIDGGAGDDMLSGGEHADTIEGGAGIDTVLLPHAAWSVERKGSGWLVTDLTNPNDYDTLTGVERLLLPSESAIALDIEGDAGTVFRLYQAAFHRTPDQAGMGYWLAVADNGFGFDTMALHFMQSPEFAGLYGDAPTNRDLARLFYLNALHREPDAAGLDFWTGVLDRGSASVGQVLMGFSDSAENQAATAQLVANGIPFIPFGGG